MCLNILSSSLFLHIKQYCSLVILKIGIKSAALKNMDTNVKIMEPWEVLKRI
jgi:hypothetical protein